MKTTYKIHPAIGVARVGDSEDYYIGPTSYGGLPTEKDGTTPVTEFRDKPTNRIRRQAARFSVYVYDDASPNGRPARIGVDIADIQWKVHIANKKAGWREFLQLDGSGPSGYGDKDSHPYRNRMVKDADRLKLIIDPGPMVVNRLLAPTQADFNDKKGSGSSPQNFPPTLYPSSITTLGAMSCNRDGSLDVVGGMGNSGCSVLYSISQQVLDNLGSLTPTPVPQDVIGKLGSLLYCGYANLGDLNNAVQGATGTSQWNTQIATAAAQPRIDTYANNDYWYDDVSDGPVTAVVTTASGNLTVDSPAWVLVGPPAYAPQIVNMVNLYDTIYDVAVREMNYRPALYANGKFDETYKPNRKAEIAPILSRPAAYAWVADIIAQGQSAHTAAAGYGTGGRPSGFFKFLRPPDDFFSSGLMPQLAGDDPINQVRNYLTLTETQYFLLSQFSKGIVDNSEPQESLGPGEQLDRAVLQNCVGGPFCPGIEMTWISRNTMIYSEPFRIKHKPLPPGNVLSLCEDLSQGMEPGDLSRYMALPWQADFNECSDQGLDDNSVWWWPAQRPYMVYPDAASSDQVPWTRSSDQVPLGFQFPEDVQMVYHWNNLGFIIQNGTQFHEVQRVDFTLTPPPK